MTPHYVASDQNVHCLSTSLKKDARLILVKLVTCYSHFLMFCSISGHMVHHVNFKLGSTIKKCVYQVPYLDLEATS